MSDGSNDTNASAEMVQLSILRHLGPERRSELSAQWSGEIRQLATQGIRDRHPGFNERQVVVEYARITLSEPVWRAAFAAEVAKRE